MKVRLESNYELKQQIIKEMKNNDLNMINYKLSYITDSLSHCVIGISNSFIKVDTNKYYSFFKGCLRLQKDFTFFSGLLNGKIIIVKNKITELMSLVEGSEEYSNLKSIIDEDLKNLVDLLAEEFNKHINNIINHTYTEAGVLYYYTNYYVDIK